ncbi:transferrin-binding protein-like solute binding protein [Ursidibacter sp. B-7004-1]
MNKNTFVKFSLTLVSAAVLAACGSSGGNGNAGTPAPAPAPAPAPTFDANAVQKNVYGGIFIKKNESSMDVGNGSVTNSESSSNPNTQVLGIEPYKTLDTIVIAVPKDSSKPATYLEDFDFRTDVATAATKAADGKTTLNHIYNSRASTKNATKRMDAAGADFESITKTSTKGEDSGVVYVYEAGRQNYTTSELERKKIAESKDARTEAKLKADKTVAEVYGYRTFADGNAEYSTDNVEHVLPNAPLGTKVNGHYTGGTQLSHVQYGRVTSSIHEKKPSDFKEGVVATANRKTIVGTYGEYGARGTENHYFFRGTNKTAPSANLTADLDAVYANDGKLVYQGHAVTYGLDREFDPKSLIPNAVGYQQQLFSGTHVTAEVNLANNDVHGVLYNVWRYGQDDNVDNLKYTTAKDFNLATFSGKLYNNGYITGGSKRTVDGAAGSFDAQLFGGRAVELGGSVASNSTTDSWGAAFGAKVQNGVRQGPTPPTSTNDWERLPEAN